MEKIYHHQNNFGIKREQEEENKNEIYKGKSK